MEFYSTRNKNHKVPLREAVLQSLAPDKGLYMPENIEILPPSFLQDIEQRSPVEIYYEVAKTLLGSSIPPGELKSIIEKSIDFPAPLVYLDDYTASLELYHGPSLAFKDFGARFMASVMSYLLRGEDTEQLVLVATSGDTGGAVAAGFHNVPGIKVIILFPSGKVSPIQEKQLTTWGNNITAIEVRGSFDDCQALVKEAFHDPRLIEKVSLSSANSINIARLIPQVFYYFDAYRQVRDKSLAVTIAVPSGNFGNLTAGLIAKKMGLPVFKFIAATNANNVVPGYLSHGIYQPKPTMATISNAMDVGAPSNFERILDLYGSTWNRITRDVFGFWLNDMDTKKAMLNAYQKYGYIADPHGAIAFQSLKTTRTPSTRIFLETAHPCKFIEIVEDVLNLKVPIPDTISEVLQKEKRSFQINYNYAELQNLILSI